LYSAADVSERLHQPVLIELPAMQDYERDSFTDPSAPEDCFVSRFMSFGKGLNKEPEDRFQGLLFKLLALRASGESGPFVIGVTSSSDGEGVSNIAANLAAAFARDDRFANTLLLDASMKNPPGELAEQAEAVLFTYQSINGIRSSTEPEGKPSGVAMFIDQLARAKKQDHDVVVVDLPPVSQGGDTARMAAALGLVILVVASGRIPWRKALWATEMLADAQAKLCGIILNQKCFAMPEWLHRKLRAF
jgi:Mrp family chromosome partitioning ATPase